MLTKWESYVVAHRMINYAVFWVMAHLRRYAWKVTPVTGIDLAVQKSEPCLQTEQVISALNFIRHGSTGASRSSLLVPGCPVKVAVF